MGEIIEGIAKLPIPFILVIVGFAFIGLANVVSAKDLRARYDGRKTLGILGVLAVLLGTAFYALDNYTDFKNTSENNEDNLGGKWNNTGGAYTNITLTQLFPAYGDGDFIFNVTPTVQQCEGGFWVNGKDPAFSETVALVQEGFRHTTSGAVYGLVDELWPGTSSKRCRLYAISFTK